MKSLRISKKGSIIEHCQFNEFHFLLKLTQLESYGRRFFYWDIKTTMCKHYKVPTDV